MSPKRLCHSHQTIGSAVLTIGLLAPALMAPSTLLSQQPTFRSSSEPRAWLADERQLPRHSERTTGRGFEVCTGPIVVLAPTRELARQAAEHATAAWNASGAL